MQSKLYRFFIFSSGVDGDLISSCPKSEKIKYSAIGATVLFTGLLACFSGGYALYTIFEDLWLAPVYAVVFGLLWGAIIFNLDRYLVSSLRKDGNRKRELLLALPRFLMAVVIALVISKPIEVRIFQDRIADQIHTNKINRALKDKQNIDQVFDQSKIAGDLSEENSSLASLEERKEEGDPKTPEFQSLLSELSTAKQAWESSERLNRPRITQCNSEIAVLNSNGYRDESNRWILSEGAKNKIASISNRRKSLQNEISNKKSRFEKIQEQISTQRLDYRRELSLRIEEAKVARKEVQDSKRLADSLANAEFNLGNQSRKISFQPNFITRLEAMGDLTAVSFSTMWWTSILISLLVMLLEISPILVKILSDKGDYDEKFETRKQKTVAYEKAERKLNDLLADSIYLRDTYTLKKVQHFSNTAKESTNIFLEFVKSTLEQNSQFDDIVENMNDTAENLTTEETENITKRKGMVISLFDKFQNGIFKKYSKMVDEEQYNN